MNFLDKEKIDYNKQYNILNTLKHKHECFKNDLLLRTLREKNGTHSVMMRQAGRYLPEYMVLREKYGFFERCQIPELVREITIQPVDIVGVDAAILFSDILVVPQAMGLEGLAD